MKDKRTNMNKNGTAINNKRASMNKKVTIMNNKGTTITNRSNFSLLVTPNENNTLKRNKERIKNRDMLKESQNIALKVLMQLDQLGWSQKDLALKMEVSPQQISKIVSGKENLTIETQIKLQNILDIPILASYYESKNKKKKTPKIKL
jgi:ribosome-binding protein aMBF1 (putative translation factor)